MDELQECALNFGDLACVARSEKEREIWTRRERAVKAAIDQLATLRAKAEAADKMAEALKPFADAADYYDGENSFADNCWPTSEGADDVRLGDFRQARAALAAYRGGDFER